MAARELILGALLACVACSPPMPGSIGIIARREPSTGRIIVVEVPPGGAGARAGLEPGDEILAIDGVPVAELSPNEFRGAVRGPAGTKVAVDLLRDGLRRRITVTRAEIRAVETKP